MKKRFLSAAFIALLAVGSFSFAACDEVGSSGDYSLTITNKAELQEEWPIGEPNRSLSVTLEPTANASSEVATGNLTVTSSNPSVVAATGLSLTAVGIGSATITASWHGASDSVDVAIVANTYDYSIADVNAGLVDGSIKDGDTISFYGQVSASYEANSTHLGSGVFLGDGDDALMLYSGQLTNYFLADDGTLAIPYGTNVGVSAEVSAYNGFFEFKPSYVEVLDASYDIKTPTVLEITESNWGSIAFTDVGRLAKAELTYVSGTVSTASSTHSTITCKIGDTEVLYYVNYHIGTDGVAAMADVINNLDAGDTFTSYGYINWYSDTPELTPAFVYVDGKVLTPGEGIQAADKPATTTLSITGSNTVEKYFSTQLGVTVDSGADRQVTWTSSAENVATISSSGLVKGLAEGKTTITATAVKAPASGTAASASITLTVTQLTHTIPFTSGNQYYFGMNVDGTFQLITGNIVSTYDYEGALTTDLASAAKVTVTAVEGSDKAFYLSFDSKYIAIVESGIHINMNYVSEATPIYWSYELEAWTNESEENFLCYNSAYDCLYCSAVSSYYGSSPVATLLTEEDMVVEPNAPVGAFTQVETPTSGSSYYLGFSSSDLMYLFNGKTDGYNDYLLCTNKASEAIEIKVTQNDTTTYDGNGETTYGLTFTMNDTEYTIYAWPGQNSGGDKQYGEITFIETANLSSAKSGYVTAFSWDSDNSTFKVTLTNGTWYFSTYASYSEISLSSNTTYGCSHLYTYDESYVEPEVNLTLATSLTSAGEYYLAYKADDNTYYYFNGQKVGDYDYYLGATTSIDEAVKVTATGDDSNGWTLTFSGKTIEAWANWNSNSSKYYGEITYNEGSSTHNGVTTFKWNSDYNTVTVDLQEGSSTTTYYLEYNLYNSTHEIQLNESSYIGSTGQAMQFFTLAE